MRMSSSGDQTVPLGKMREKGSTGTRTEPQTSGWGNGEERVLLAGWHGQERQDSVTGERRVLKANRQMAKP